MNYSALTLGAIVVLLGGYFVFSFSIIEGIEELTPLDAKSIHNEINQIRELNGLSPLSWNDSLSDIAYLHSKDMALNDFFDHIAPNGLTFDQRYENSGYDCVNWSGENLVIVLNNYTPEQTVKVWLDSPGHKENILFNDYKTEGIGIFILNDKSYITQNFC